MISYSPILVAFIVAGLCAWLLKPLAARLELVAVPGGRKAHQGNIPLVGGIAMLFGLAAGLLVLNLPLHHYRAFLAGIAVLAFAGLLDDFHELSARSKFIAQLIAALLMVFWGHNKLFSLGHLFFGEIILLQYHLAVPVTVFAILSIINAINMLDGMDGLAGGIVLVELMLLFALAQHAGQVADAMILAILAGSVAAFLCFNYRLPGRRHALIFMGDVGSMFLGFVLVWFCVKLSQVGQATLPPIAFLFIMALPLLDTASVMARRMCRGKSPFHPDSTHLHHLLLRLGLSVGQTTSVMYVLTLMFGLIGVLGAWMGVREGALFVCALGIFVIYCVLLHYLWKLPQAKLGKEAES